MNAADDAAGIAARLTACLASLAAAPDGAEALLETGRDCLDALDAPVRVAVGGEFSSGKSSLVKMLLGAHVVRPGAAASAAPTVRFHHAPGAPLRLYRGAVASELRDAAQLAALDLIDYDRLDVGLDLALLRELEIYDTPGTSDPNRAQDQITKVAAQVDFIIWCTNATQAWRQSERKLFAGLNDTMRHRSLLVVTHVDLPAVKASLERLMTRLRQDAGALFHAIVPMDVPSAIAARDADNRVTDGGAWRGSGGEEFLDRLRGVIGAVRESRVADAAAFLELVATADVSAPVADAVADAPAVEMPEAGGGAWMAGYAAFLRAAPAVGGAGAREDAMRLLRGLAGAADAAGTDGAAAGEVTLRAAEACDYLDAMDAAAWPGGMAEHVGAVLAQLDREFRRLVRPAHAATDTRDDG